MAEKLKEVFHKKGYTFFLESPTNQQFIILENEKMKELSKNVEFGFWEKYDDKPYGCKICNKLVNGGKFHRSVGRISVIYSCDNLKVISN